MSIIVRLKPVLKPVFAPFCLCRLSGRNGGQFSRRGNTLVQGKIAGRVEKGILFLAWAGELEPEEANVEEEGGSMGAESEHGVDSIDRTHRQAPIAVFLGRKDPRHVSCQTNASSLLQARATLAGQIASLMEAI